MQILGQFGIEGKLLIVQLVNFVFLLAVFWKFILPRITKMLDERKRQVAESVKNSERAQKLLEQTEHDATERQAEAERQAAELIKEAKASAAETREELLGQAKQDADTLRTRTKAQLAADRTAMAADLRAELTALTVATARRVLGDVITPADRERLVKSAADHLKREAKAGKKTGGKRVR